MKHASVLFGLGVLLFTAAPVLAKPAYVAATVNLRAAPGTQSEIVAKIPGGSLVESRDCSEGWCEIIWKDKTGFAIQTALDLSGRVPRPAAAQARASARYATPNEGYVPDDEPVYYEAPPPRVYYYGGPYYRPYWGWRRWGW
jgi:uncharacterized protein YraI